MSLLLILIYSANVAVTNASVGTVVISLLLMLMYSANVPVTNADLQ